MSADKKIDNPFLASITDGLTFVPQMRATHTLPSHVPYQSYYSDAATALQRRNYALPRVVGYLEGLPDDGCDIVCDGIVVKNQSSLTIGLPSCFDFALPLAQFAAHDLLADYGREKFFRSELRLVAQRTTIPQGEAGRAHFSHWHNHVDHKLDAVYSWSDRLSTVFRNGEKISEGPDGSVVRFGGEIDHASKKNSEGLMRRTWLAVTARTIPVSLFEKPVQAHNVAIVRPTPGFEKAAQEFSLSNPAHFRSVEPYVLENFL